MNQLLAPVIISLLFLIPTSSEAANSENREGLEKSVFIVRDNLILKGITAYKAGKYHQAVLLLSNFLNRRRVIATPVEIEGLSYLALAYQQIGEQIQATETIIWAISIFNNSPLELANLENIAGIIAYRQNKKVIANKHWEKARQLYLANNVVEAWAKTTLNLATNYKKLGELKKSQQLLSELERANLKLNLSDSAIPEI